MQQQKQILCGNDNQKGNGKSNGNYSSMGSGWRRRWARLSTLILRTWTFADGRVEERQRFFRDQTEWRPSK